MVNFDQWFMREVEKGISAADRGELVDHNDVQKLIDRRYPGKCSYAGRFPQPATLRKSATTLSNMEAPRPRGELHCPFTMELLP